MGQILILWAKYHLGTTSEERSLKMAKKPVSVFLAERITVREKNMKNLKVLINFIIY